MIQQQVQTVNCHNLSDLDKAAQQLLAFSKGVTTVLFNGAMGAGKTTFIKSICERLKVDDVTSSPTFSIVNEYHTKDGYKIYHFDFYRLKSEYEALDIGFEEYLDSGDYCFIEWPEKVSSLLPNEYIKVNIEVVNEERIITFEKVLH